MKTILVTTDVSPEGGGYVARMREVGTHGPAFYRTKVCPTAAAARALAAGHVKKHNESGDDAWVYKELRVERTKYLEVH